jgi:hypothetical protein
METGQRVMNGHVTLDSTTQMTIGIKKKVYLLHIIYLFIIIIKPPLSI